MKELLLIPIIAALLANLAVAAELADYRNQFDDKLAKIISVRDKAAKASLATYKPALTNLFAAVKKTGDLDNSLLVSAELTRFEKEGSFPTTRPSFPALASVYDTHATKLAKVELARARRVDELATRYDQALQKFQASLVTADKLPQAQKVKNERERAAGLDLVASSRTLIDGEKEKAVEGTDAVGPVIKKGHKILIYSEADAYAWKEEPGKNFGTSDVVVAKDSKKGGTRWGYLRFEIKSLRNRSVKSAVIRLRCLESSNRPAPCEAFLVTDNDWKEQKLTWRNRPATGASVGKIPVGESGGFVELDVTKMITGLPRRASAVSICIMPKGTSAVIKYASRESEEEADRPVLMVTEK